MSRRVPVACLLAALFVLGWTTTASAHPFGDPPVLTIEAEGDTIELGFRAAADEWHALGASLGLIADRQVYVFDDTGAQVDGDLSPERALADASPLRHYLERRLRVQQDGTTCPAQVTDLTAPMTRGATLTVTCPDRIDEITVEATALMDLDPRYRIVVSWPTARPDTGVLTAEAPAHTFRSGATDGDDLPNDVAAAGAMPLSMTRVFDAPGALWAALALAVGLGAFHALAPGHGKTLVAAHLVGSQARARHAVALGAAVGTMHTVSALALALLWSATLGRARELELEQLTAGMQLVAAIVVVAVGVHLVRRRRSGHVHTHNHDAAADQPLWSIPGLAALGLAGGLVPSPSAFVVLVSGLATGRTTFAVVLVLAFGAGLAAVVSIVGWASLRGRDLLTRTRRSHGAFGWAARVLPVASAWAVVAVGAMLSVAATIELAA